jgi:hypothetical protein
MPYEQRDNTGSLFKNTEKRNERGPDYSGTCLIEGVEFFFDGWIKQKEGGRAWMSFSLKRKEKQAQQPTRQAPRRSRDDDDFEGPPF